MRIKYNYNVLILSFDFAILFRDAKCSLLLGSAECQEYPALTGYPTITSSNKQNPPFSV